jgi:murein DD-endopeptidase MepM/ murein hydrolase activator NlpD
MTRTSLIVLMMFMGAIALGQKPPKDLLQGKAKATKAKAAALRKELRKTRRQIGYVMADIHKADTQLEDTRARLQKTESNLQVAKARQAALVGELKAASAKLEQKRALVARRMRALYMQGDRGAIGALVGRGGFTEVADRSFVIHKIAERDDQLVNDLRDAREEVRVRKAEQDELVRRVASLKQRQVVEKIELNRRMQTKKGFLQELRETESETQQQLDELERESNAIEAELRKYYGSPEGTRVPAYRGRFRLPVAGRITSGFGNRFHPILHRTKLHTGLDIAAPTGTPIHAAGPGRVIYSGYRGGYGNCIIIDHGGGIATLYGHCSRLTVGVGANVQAGDVIAAVGSTGFSTGPHCHWEVRVNGTPVNPQGR